MGRIFAVDGRLVRTLLDDVVAAGSHALTWDGRDGMRRSVASGIDVARMPMDGGATASRRVLSLP